MIASKSGKFLKLQDVYGYEPPQFYAPGTWICFEWWGRERLARIIKVDYSGVWVESAQPGRKAFRAYRHMDCVRGRGWEE